MGNSMKSCFLTFLSDINMRFFCHSSLAFCDWTWSQSCQAFVQIQQQKMVDQNRVMVSIGCDPSFWCRLVLFCFSHRAALISTEIPCWSGGWHRRDLWSHPCIGAGVGWYQPPQNGWWIISILQSRNISIMWVKRSGGLAKKITSHGLGPLVHQRLDPIQVQPWRRLVPLSRQAASLGWACLRSRCQGRDVDLGVSWLVSRKQESPATWTGGPLAASDVQEQECHGAQESDVTGPLEALEHTFYWKSCYLNSNNLILW